MISPVKNSLIFCTVVLWSLPSWAYNLDIVNLSDTNARLFFDTPIATGRNLSLQRVKKQDGSGAIVEGLLTSPIAPHTFSGYPAGGIIIFDNTSSFTVTLIGKNMQDRKCFIHLTGGHHSGSSANYGVFYEDVVPKGCQGVEIQQEPSYPDCSGWAPGNQKKNRCISFFNRGCLQFTLATTQIHKPVQA